MRETFGRNESGVDSVAVIESNRIVEIIHDIFNNERMDTAVQIEIDKLKDLIINAVPVEQIYLFGSYAYGTPHKDSDLDFYVVLKDEVEIRELDAGLQIRMAIVPEMNMPFDIIAKKKSNFLSRVNGSTLERKINRDGIRIYG